MNTKINETEKKIADHNIDKNVTTQEFNKLTAESFTARLAQANLASKNYIADLVKIKLATKAELKVDPNKINKIQTYNSSFIIGQNYFGIGGAKII